MSERGNSGVFVVSRSRSPSSPDPCLVHSRRVRFRGGTLIIFDVHDLAEHERRARHPGGYRPAACPRCGCQRLHLHDRLERILVGERGETRIRILRYVCVAPDCRATWRVLPAFVARHLWRQWTTVARAIAGDPDRHDGPRVAARTRRRWNSRLDSAARQLLHLLTEHDDEDVTKFVQVAGFDSTRRELVELFTAGRVLGTHGIADIAAAVHIIEPGIRLM